jgi:signal transduction histidine kinase
MILLITPSQRGAECATAIQSALEQPAEAVKSFQEAAICLRTKSYSAVIVDECLVDADPDQASLVLKHIQTAIPVYVNGAMNGIARVVDKVQVALQRRAQDEAAARLSALTALSSELREPLTGILLNCELVLEAANLEHGIKEKIRAVHELARQLGAKLQLDQCSSSRKAR